MYNLEILLNQIDGMGYKGYKDIKGSYDFKEYILNIINVQGDPFASPSFFEIEIDIKNLKLPMEVFKEDIKIATEDFLLREISKNIKRINTNQIGSGKSGHIYILKPSNKILKRSAIEIIKKKLSIKFYVGLPAKGRRILGREAIKIIFEKLPGIYKIIKNVNIEKLKNHINLYRNIQKIREYLKKNNYILFIANDSILPRESSISEKPMKNAIKFQSPKELEIEIPLDKNKIIKGMGIKEGITVITGGGFHGKTTLLEAIEMGIYNHIYGDGREYVITREDAIKIKAENGRFINNTNISSFIQNLPNKKDTEKFFTENASGSTSQAANIIEALEIGSRFFLIDEDTTATNFMIRDDFIKKIIADNKEPIRPFIENIKALKEQNDTSVIMIVGSLSEYFKIADTVLMLDEYRVKNITNKVKKILVDDVMHKNNKIIVTDRKLNIEYCRNIVFNNKFKIKNKGFDELNFGNYNIDFRNIEQIVEEGQIIFIGELIKRIFKRKNQTESLYNILNSLENRLENENISEILNAKSGKYCGIRKYEIAMAINRLREQIIK
ncbi:putative ABC-class ATPase [Hypnocyclicus thermotrophus]|uniref:ABC-class ATPase n=1 Tax=Hypnocyclicus thermotrophus TaxID=1627895 RepID=A0AA46DZK9_9FUSO|nr:ABC-ATPase domain-containing protein [Hypnocyclicus thermotrophus]TDT71887.1 putative ABC-class ATPase [Hypnocyclicus thermotrophus]